MRKLTIKLPRISSPGKPEADSDLEWLLCLATTFQACQRPTVKPWALRWRLALNRLGVKPKAG